MLIETVQPVGVVVKHIGLWTRRREFESLTGYHNSFLFVHDLVFGWVGCLYRKYIQIAYTATSLWHVGFDPQFGARPIKRVIQKDILNELSKMLLSEKVNKDTMIIVDEKNGQLIFKNK